jgi:hypothetical protein
MSFSGSNDSSSTALVRNGLSRAGRAGERREARSRPANGRAGAADTRSTVRDGAGAQGAAGRVAQWPTQRA